MSPLPLRSCGTLKYRGESIVVAVADPEPSLVVRLFAEHRGTLVWFFHRRIRSKADAQDLAQEVYLRMLRVSDQQAIRDPVLYLYTVANNLVKECAVLDYARAARDAARVRWRSTTRSRRPGRPCSAVIQVQE